MQDMTAMLGMSSGGNKEQEQEDGDHMSGSPMPQAGGRRRRRSRTRKGRKGKGGYMMDVAVAAGLLGATQYMKRRRGYGSTKKRSSRRSRRSSRSRGRR
jgi:hypothetical protein